MPHLRVERNHDYRPWWSTARRWRTAEIARSPRQVKTARNALRCGTDRQRRGRARSGRRGEGRRAEQENGHGGPPDDTVGDAAPEEFGTPAASVRAERDQIRAKGVRLDQDLLDRLAEPDDTLHADAVEPRRHRVEASQTCARQIGNELDPSVRRFAGRDWNQNPLGQCAPPCLQMPKLTREIPAREDSGRRRIHALLTSLSINGRTEPWATGSH